MTKETFELLEKDIIEKVSNVKDTSHDINHISRVRENSLKICNVLNLKDDDIDKYLLQIICLLHDFAFTYKKSNLFIHIFEGTIVKKIVKKYLEPISDLTKEEKGVILTAVKNHPGSFPYKFLNKNKDIYSKILQDSDTLDLFRKERISNLKNDYPIMMFFMKNMFNPGPEKIKKYLNFEKSVEILYKNDSL